MSDTSGFYLCEEGQLLHAPNFVINKDYELRREMRDQYEYPVHGWFWFDSEAEAKIYWKIINNSNGVDI